ncbi:presenilins-associated rhomboid-like protein, mitochondrial [Ctenocephalides felis]|uniref:presenilins-associated rhomboid-like protein, mitochondrial n=1 Tax=Ctenocephalides felis TaxID=7515 RepID=UPI000E6E54E7|nr:presenilins-associated rhomboid-like protein, mitochondrial [Ctenocephalides felis]
MTWSKLNILNLLHEVDTKIVRKFFKSNHLKYRVTNVENAELYRDKAKGYNKIIGAIGQKGKIKFCPNIATTGTNNAIPGKVFINTGPVEAEALWKPFMFTVAFTSISFMMAVILQYERVRNYAYRALKDPDIWFNYQNDKHRSSSRESQIAKKNWWNNLSSGERVFLPICIANIIVFGAWRIPSLLPVMVKKFCSNPASSSPCWPMFLSTFSHYSPLHLFANMYVLHSFSAVAMSSLSPEEFLALYFSSGVIASFCSYLVKAATGKSGLTLGASGAIMGIIGFVCLRYPETKLSIIFLPWVQFSALSAIKAMMALDITGILMGWRVFDHGAHVGGGLAGIFWSLFGHPELWQKRETLLKYWVKIRGGQGPN